MKHFLITFLVLLVGSAHAQSLGRLPGTVYPSDRGARTENTLLVVQNDLGTRGAEWYIDGNWVIDGNHFTFRSNDVVRMLPGSRFTVATGYTLGLGSAEFWAAREQCFYSTGGTITGGKYPHLFPEWGSLTNKGYLDSPYDYELITSTNDYTNLGGVGSLESAMDFMNTNWHTAAGYVTTNQFNTLTGAVYNISTNFMRGTNIVGGTYSNGQWYVSQNSSSFAGASGVYLGVRIGGDNKSVTGMVNRATDTTIPYTIVPGTTNVWDSKYFVHSTGSGNTTIHSNGLYRITARVSDFIPNIANNNTVIYYLNTSGAGVITVLRYVNDYAATGDNIVLTGSVIQYLTAGTTAYSQLWVDSFNAGAATLGFSEAQLSIERIGD